MPTKSIIVERADGSVDRYAFNGGTAPAIRITEGPSVPYLPPGMHLTQGRVEDYEERRVMMLSEHALQQLGHRPGSGLLSSSSSKYVPRPGDDVGYVNFKPLKYLGRVRPIASTSFLHVFGVLDDSYVSLTGVLDLLYAGEKRIVMYTRAYAQKSLNASSARLVIRNTPHNSRYDTLLLLKTLGAIDSRNARAHTFVRTRDVDMLLAHSGSDEQLDWRFVAE